VAIDVAPLWDFGDPAASEQRFRAAIVRAAPDDAFILQTQIARTFGLRKDFARARQLLVDIEPKLASASPEAQARWYLEMGRTWASAAHTREQLTPESRERARVLYMRAFDTAKAAKLDGLAIDALHMMVVVDDAPAQQLEWNLKAIEFMDASDQPAAKRWAGSLYYNAGYALRQAGRLEEAIAYYRKSAAAYEESGRPDDAREINGYIARLQSELNKAAPGR
jgi:tetratricopeptide (TPR) repeat protein